MNALVASALVLARWTPFCTAFVAPGIGERERERDYSCSGDTCTPHPHTCIVAEDACLLLSLLLLYSTAARHKCVQLRLDVIGAQYMSEYSRYLETLVSHVEVSALCTSGARVSASSTVDRLTYCYNTVVCIERQHAPLYAS